MNVLFILGDVSVGKMTVGQEIAKRTGMILFYNHITIEPVITTFGEFRLDVTKKLRDVFYKELAKADVPGVIHTLVMNWDSEEDWDCLRHIQMSFLGAHFYGLVLEAPLSVRLERCETENRLLHKPSQRDIKATRQRMCGEHTGRLEDISLLPFDNSIRIDNTNKSPAEVAEQAIAAFNFKTVGGT